MTYQNLIPLNYKTGTLAAIALSALGITSGFAAFSKTGSTLDGIVVALAVEAVILAPILFGYFTVRNRIMGTVQTHEDWLTPAEEFHYGRI